MNRQRLIDVSQQIVDRLSRRYYLAEVEKQSCHGDRGAIRVLFPKGKFHTIKFDVTEADVDLLSIHIEKQIYDYEASENQRSLGKKASHFDT